MNGTVTIPAHVDRRAHLLAREPLLEPFVAVARARNEMMLVGSSLDEPAT